MRKNKTLIKTQRKSLDEKLRGVLPLRSLLLPRAGWVKAIREALGMTSQQLAERMGIQQSGVILLEQREVDKKITLETLERAAQALNCKLVYAVIPQGESLEQILDQQSLRAAHSIMQKTQHTMELEMQTVGVAEADMHEKELAAELKRKLDSRIWRKNP